MRAKKGDWFSLKWDITNFYDPLSYEHYDMCPRFIYAEEDSLDIESEAINKFYRLRLISISLTSVFISGKDGVKLPTHYSKDGFMPGERPSYDSWISRYHKVNFEIPQNVKIKEALNQKNIYLEHAAKIIRHDMHSGINTYIPRGYKSLLRRIPEDVVSKYNLKTSLKLLGDGINHAQKVYSGVYAFTNLVKKDAELERKKCSLSDIIKEYMSGTAYSDQVIIENLVEANVNESLFCTALDNLIRNGLKYNDSETKFVKIYMENEKTICIQDNGRGLSKEDFYLYCKPYTRKENQAEPGSGLGLNIAVSILNEHGFSIEPEKLSLGTVIRINIDEQSNKEYIIGR